MQVKSLFKSSKSNDNDTSVSKKSAQSTMVPDGQPLSYSEFIVQGTVPSLSRGVPEPQIMETRDRGTQGGGGKQNKELSGRETGDDGTATVQERSTGAKAAHIEKQEVRAALEGNQRAGTLSEGKQDTQRDGMVSSSIPKPLGTGNSILVSPRQRGNPLLKFVRNVPWEFGDVTPDYVLGQTTCALFLSLRYHSLNPNYIHDRLKQLGKTFSLRVLLAQVDVKDPHHCVKDLARICIMADCTLILAWSPEEAGRYLETYKSYEKKPADLLKERVEQDFLSRVTDCLTAVKSVNKTDTLTLLATFSVSRIYIFVFDIFVCRQLYLD
ncbi:ERCC1 protein, partial [Polyodon spathula]|nr:ERCC1 protein [Polyodon spathula]